MIYAMLTFIIMGTICDLLFFRFFLKIDLKRNLYGLALVANTLALGVLFVVGKIIYPSIPLESGSSSKEMLEMLIFIIVKFGVYWGYIPKEKHYKLVTMLFFSTLIAGVLSGVLILISVKIL